MKRREFITLVGGAAIARPLPARAQQPAMPVIGFLNSASPEPWADRLGAFQRGLNEGGYGEGRNVTIAYRGALGEYDRLPELAADLVRHQATVIAAGGAPASARAAMAATSTIPIVFATGTDPIAAGLVTSLKRPGGNVTGVSTLNVEIGPKRLELMHEVLPATAILALVINPTNLNAKFLSTAAETAARSLGRQLHVLHVSTERDFDAVFATLRKLRPGGLVIGTDSYLISRSEQLARLTVRDAIPAIHHNRDFVAAGGLMSYGGSPRDSYRLLGIYTGRILKGERPADLPVQQATKVELIISLKTAKALGLTVPQTLLALADEVIE